MRNYQVQDIPHKLCEVFFFFGLWLRALLDECGGLVHINYKEYDFIIFFPKSEENKIGKKMKSVKRNLNFKCLTKFS